MTTQKTIALNLRIHPDKKAAKELEIKQAYQDYIRWKSWKRSDSEVKIFSPR